MRVFKTSYRDRDGQTRQVEKWWTETRDHLGIIRRFAGYTDRGQTEILGKNIDKLVVRRKNNEPPDGDLSGWITSMDTKLRDRLVKVGILTADRATIGKLLSENISDYRESLAARNRTCRYIKETISAIKRIAADCRFKYWTDISAARVEIYLKRLREDGISHTRSNAYLRAFKMFAIWMVQAGRAGESPVRYVKGLNVDADVRHSRRALSVDEIRRLLEVTATQPERFGMVGYERSLLYRLAVESGLRANEIRSLLVGSFDFDRQTVTVESQHTKNHKEAVLPLRPDTAAELKQFLAGKLPSVKAFGGTYKSLTDKTAEMIKADLAEAGISYCDESGRYADFHSLRHTTGSLLAASGVHPKTAQSIMRHSTIELTMSRYTHTLTGQEAEAIESLPDFSAPSSQAQRATGTDGKNLAENLALQGGLDRSGLDCIGQVNHTSAVNNAVSNTPGRIRTCDLRIRNPLLYPTELRALLS